MLTRAGSRPRRPIPPFARALPTTMGSTGAVAQVGPAALGASLAALFASIAIEYPRWYQRDANLEHAPLVAAAAGWMAWRAQRVRSGRATTTAAGVAAVGLGVVLELSAWFVGSLGLEMAALVVTALGILAAVASAGLAARLAFPAAFLLFAAPLPAVVYQPLALTLQAWVCGLSAWVLQLLGVAVFRQGSLLHLAGHVLDVGLACAGVRQMSAFLALTLAAGHLSGRSWGYRSVLALLALPIALAANVTRVLLTAAIVLRFGPRWVEGTWHDLEGTFLVALGIALVLGSAHALAHLPGPLFDWRPPAPSRTLGAAASRRSSIRPVLAVLVAGVVVKGMLAWHLAAAEPVPVATLRQPLAALPLVLGEWRGSDLPIPRSWGLGEDRIRRRYANPRTGEELVVWVDYSSRGDDRGHHPEVCMAVAGLREDPQGHRRVPLPGYAQPAQRFRFVGREESEAVYYWHYTLPPVQPARSDALRRLHQRLRERPASVTVEVFASEPTQASDEGLTLLLARLDGALQPHLPAGAVRGSERRAVFLVNGPFAGVWR